MRMVSSVNWPHVVNLGNSIIGVSILTMPFCFQQCGIILGTLLLLFCTWMTLVSCQLLMKAGITSRRKSYEFLAYHTLGGGGKFAIEFLLIGLQLGTMIAQIVVIGDLGPSIIAKFTGFENTNKLRSGLIVMMCLFVGLPLGLLKNVRSLSSASTMCVCFYTIFVISMIFTSIPNLWLGNWVVKVRYWRTEGLFQCIPIFSLAFGCQTQLFILYDDLPEPSFKVINKIVSNAVNICSVAYLLVGFFGYIAFCSTEITGDIINMLTPSLFTDIIKLAFVFSIAVTFPLIIFPCRTSLYTMLFPRRPKTSDGFEMSHQIPELHFKLMTIAIVVISMLIGMSVPNVEFILGLNGATMGTLICYIMPALFFLKVMTATSEGKTLAKLVLVMGILVLLISTYTTLNFQDKSHHAEHQEEKRLKDNIAAKEAVQDIIAAKQPPVVDQVAPVNGGHAVDHQVNGDHVGDGQDKAKEKDAHRHEPPVPKPPDELPEIDQSNEKLKAAEANKKLENEKKKAEAAAADAAAAANVKAQGHDLQGAKDADKSKIGKEDGVKQEGPEKKQEELLHKLEEQHQEQKKILEEQRELLKELKKHRVEEHEVDNQQLPNKDGAAPVAGVQGNVLLKQGINANQGVLGGNLQGAQMPKYVAPQQKVLAQQNVVLQPKVVPQQNGLLQQNPILQKNLAQPQNVLQQNAVPPQNVALNQAVLQNKAGKLLGDTNGKANVQGVVFQNPKMAKELPAENLRANLLQRRDSGNLNLQPVPVQAQVPVQQVVQQQVPVQQQQPVQQVVQQQVPVQQQQQVVQQQVPVQQQQPVQQVVQQQVPVQQQQQVVQQQVPVQQQQPVQQVVQQQVPVQQQQQVVQQQVPVQQQQPVVQQQVQPVQQQVVQQQVVQQQPVQVVQQPVQQQQQVVQPAQVNIPLANKQGRRLMRDNTKGEIQQSKPNKDSNIQGSPINQAHGIRQKRDVLIEMKEQKQLTDKVKPEDLGVFPQVDGIDKKHFEPIIMRSLKSAKEEDVASN